MQRWLTAVEQNGDLDVGRGAAYRGAGKPLQIEEQEPLRQGEIFLQQAIAIE